MAGRKIDLYGEAQAANEVQILDHLGLVKRMALHLKVRVPPFIELDELIQAGMLGLMEAAKSFDISKGIPFENFAQIRIKGSMIDEVRRMSYLPRSAVAISSGVGEKADVTGSIWSGWMQSLPWKPMRLAASAEIGRAHV